MAGADAGKQRSSGILLHPGSLPGTGTLGADARRFVDFLANAGVGWWQVLPLGPTHADRSPYNSLSAFAGNPEWIDVAEASQLISPASGQLDLSELCNHVTKHPAHPFHEALLRFRHDNRHWLEDFALFMSLRRRHEQRPWYEWPAAYRDRQQQALDEARDTLSAECQQRIFEQFLFTLQWSHARGYARQRHVHLIGDLPFFVAHDSADAWRERSLFQLDDQGQARFVAGVPPDAFAIDGQLWGHPQYNWEVMRQTGYRWWLERLRHLLRHVDCVRLDHFRGLDAIWQIDGRADTAAHGQWVPVPGSALLATLRDNLGRLPVVAEDLGTISEGTRHLMERFDLPGMRVLQFAFDGNPDNPHLPHNHSAESLVYPGTHDNDTCMGWFTTLDTATRKNLLSYLGQPAEPMPWPVLRCALRSVARLCIISMQDLCADGSAQRMNTPGTVGGMNWRYRLGDSVDLKDIADRLRPMLHQYGRLAGTAQN